MEATLTYKGQVTIPALIREKLNISSGDKIDFVYINHNKAEIIVRKNSIADLKGALKKPDFKASIEDMNNAIEESNDRN